MADINNNDIWIDVETLAKLKNITRRAVRLALNQNKYEYKVENIRGGKTYKIKLSTLEEELQLEYFQEYYDDYKTCDNEVIELSNLKIKQEKLISENQRKIALAKYDLIYAWLDFRKEYKRDKFKANGNIPDKEFLQLYNTGMFQEEIFKILGKVSIGSLYRWRALLDYNKDWTALVGQYKYSTRKEYRTTLNEEQIKIFIQILLSPSAFSIGKAISLTKHILKERGQEILPKDITFRRYAEWFRDNNFDKWTLARDGEKALKDKVSPFIVRNAALLKAGQVLVADGHTLNFQVINPFTGKPCRATLLGFLDWKSGGLVGYDIMLEECTQNVASALRNAILKMDHIPEYVYQDNGRAFKSKFFNGDKKFEELGFTGVYNKLGIKELGEIPYNKFSDIFNQVVSQLIKTPRTIIVDETDYLTIDSRAVETLRDIHDKTNVPIVLVGMGTANKRLQRHKHLYDRLLEIIKFEPFSKQDITSIIDQLSEVSFTDCAKKLLYTRTNRFRQLVKTISKAEQVAKSNGIKEIDEITLKEVLKNDDADAEEIELTNENS